MINEEKKGGAKDACYHKVKSRYSVWPSAYASGALVKCRKVGAKNWGNKKEDMDFYNSVCNYLIEEGFAADVEGANSVILKLNDDILNDIYERKMTKGERTKETKLKGKYDDSGMKASMIQQYGPVKGPQVYFATIRKQAMEEVEVEEGFKSIDKDKENRMYRRAGNLARQSLASKGKKKYEAAKKSANIVSAITRQKENERFAKMADEKARDNYGESFEIDPKKHKAAQKDQKIRNMIQSPNENEAAVAKKKAKGPKLFGEELHPNVKKINDIIKKRAEEKSAAAAAAKQNRSDSAAAFQAHKKEVLAKGGRPVDALDSWQKKQMKKEEVELSEAPFQVYDMKDKVNVGKEMKNKKRARTKADKLDQEYGAYRYKVIPTGDDRPEVKYGTKKEEVEFVSEKDEKVEAKYKGAKTPYLLSKFRKEHPGSRQEKKVPGAKETEGEAAARRRGAQAERAAKHGLTSKEKKETQAREKYYSARD